MRNVRMTLQMLIFILLISIASVQAQMLVCWDINPFDDTMRALVAMTPDDEALFALTAVHWQGGKAYQLSGSTATRLFESTPTTVQFSVYMDNPTSFWGNHPDCRLRVTLQREGLSGSWVMNCTGSPSTPFTVSGTLVLDSCEPGVSVGVSVNRNQANWAGME